MPKLVVSRDEIIEMLAKKHNVENYEIEIDIEQPLFVRFINFAKNGERLRCIKLIKENYLDDNFEKPNLKESYDILMEISNVLKFNRVK